MARSIENKAGVKIGSFLMEIPEGRETEEGYVVLTHGQHYALRLRSDHDGDCDVDVSIDGESVGCWRLEPGITYRIERPISEPGKFTFYVAGTGEAQKAGIVKTDSTGVLSARFMPEKVVPKPSVQFMPSARFMPGSDDNRLDADAPGGPGDADVRFSKSRRTGPPSGAMAGGTGLSGFSEQTFGTTARRIDHDKNAIVTINLRLIALSNEPRPLHRSNPVPPPVP